LESSGLIFPRLGNRRQFFSKVWKIGWRFFQTLEKCPRRPATAPVAGG
jgi:hypothetical protein